MTVHVGCDAAQLSLLTPSIRPQIEPRERGSGPHAMSPRLTDRHLPGKPVRAYTANGPAFPQRGFQPGWLGGGLILRVT